MKFSRGTISIDDKEAKISINSRRNTSSFSIELQKFKEYSYYRDKSSLEIKNWPLVLFQVGLIFLYGFLRPKFFIYGLTHDQLATLDIIVIPTLTFLVIFLFIEILAEFRLLRNFYSWIFTRKRSYLRIVLDSGKTYKIPVKNEKEAIQMIEFIQSPE